MRSIRITAIAAIALLAGALVAPTSADARNGRIAAGVVGGFAAGALFGAAIAVMLEIARRLPAAALEDAKAATPLDIHGLWPS